MRLLAIAAAVTTLASIAALGSAACSSSDAADAPPVDTTNNEDASVGDESVPYPAPHMALPQIFFYGGPVLASPQVIPVFFPGFTFRTELLDLAKKLGPSAHWKAIASEYGVGKLTVAAPIDVTQAQAPTTTTIYDSDVQAWLASRFDGTHPEFGSSPIPGAIYTLFYPADITIIEGDRADGGTGRASCGAFGGYHREADIKGLYTAYAVIPTCSGYDSLTGIDATTAATAHEWIEAATDPFFFDKPAYQDPDDDHAIWGIVLGGGEVADLCNLDNATAYYKPADIGYTVQRSWSNVAAKAGQDPCVPAATDEPYFNAAPALTEDIKFGAGTTKGVTVAVGQSRTIDVDVFSLGPTSAPIAVKVDVFGVSHTGPIPSDEITATLDRRSGQNGDVLALTIKANKQTQLGVAGFILTATVGKTSHHWVGIVGS